MKSFVTKMLVIGVVVGGIMMQSGSKPVTAAGPAKEGLYINYSHRDNIDVIDFATHKVLRTMQGIPGMHGMSFSPDGKRIYVVSETKDMLGVVDQVTGKVIKTVPLSGPAHSTTALTKDGKQLFVGIWASWAESAEMSAQKKSAAAIPGALEIYDTATMERVKSIPMKSGMHDISLTPDDKYVIAGSAEGHFITVVDVQTQEPAWDLHFDGEVYTIAAEEGPGGATRRLFVDRGNLHGFEIVDFAKRQVVGKITLPETDRFKANTHPKQADSPAHGIAVAPDNKTLWANSRWGDAVFVYSLPDLKLLGHVNVGKGPNWITFSPDSKTVFDGNAEEQSLSVIDAKSLEVTRLQLVTNPKRFYGVSLP